MLGSRRARKIRHSFSDDEDFAQEPAEVPGEEEVKGEEEPVTQEPTGDSKPDFAGWFQPPANAHESVYSSDSGSDSDSDVSGSSLSDYSSDNESRGYTSDSSDEDDDHEDNEEDEPAVVDSDPFATEPRTDASNDGEDEDHSAYSFGSSTDSYDSDSSRGSLSSYDSEDDYSDEEEAASPSRRRQREDSRSEVDSRSEDSESGEDSASDYDSASDAEDATAAQQEDEASREDSRKESASDSEASRSGDDSASDSDSASYSEASRSGDDSASDSDSASDADSYSDDSESDYSADARFTEEFLNSSLKEKGVERFDFDVTAFLLYVQDLAGCAHADDRVNCVAFRVARYINSVLPGNPMGDDLEFAYLAINALANLIGSCEEMPTLTKVMRVAAKVDGGLPTDTEPSTRALSYAVPVVLAHTETPLEDVATIVASVYPFLPALQISSSAATVFPLAETTQVDEIVAALKGGDEASAIKLYQSYRLQPSAKELPIALSMDLDVFEARVRGLGADGLRKVCGAIPIDGDAVEEAFDEDVLEARCDPHCETFVRGEALGVTIDDVPNTESAFAHLFGDEDSE